MDGQEAILPQRLADALSPMWSRADGTSVPAAGVNYTPHIGARARLPYPWTHCKAPAKGPSF